MFFIILECFLYENVDIAIYKSDEYKQLSWVNGIFTKRGGMHVDLISMNIIKQIRALVGKKYKDIKPADIKNKLFFVINVKNMNAPRFDSQTKEELINTGDDFESKLFHDIDYVKIAKKTKTNDIIFDNIIEAFKIKEELKKRNELKSNEKQLKQKSIPKLIESQLRDKKQCSLYLAEGQSALQHFLTCRNKDFAAYPLRGKFLNVYDLSLNKILKNEEVKDLLIITGLKLSDPSIYNFKYKKIVILTDADYDGDAIASLLISFFYKFWPDLFKKGYIYKAVTPLIVAKNDKKERKYFFSNAEYKDNQNDWKIEGYNKGLGSLSEEEYSFSLNNLAKIDDDIDSEISLNIAFSKDPDPRKGWLLS